jgi:MscS family membrane protein
LRRTHRYPARVPFLPGCVLASLGLLLLAFGVPARATSADEGKGPTEGDRGGEQVAAPRYGSPRDTLRTLYFAIDVYGRLPERIDDAVACLGEKPAPEEEQVAARLAIQFEAILAVAAVPLSNVPAEPDGDAVVIYDDKELKIGLRRSTDGRWVFDPDTIRHVPEMLRVVRGRSAATEQRRAGLRPGATDPRTTLRNFLREAISGKYQDAAQYLDLSGLSNDERRERGGRLAHRLAFVIQRRGYLFTQEVPDDPNALPYTWHADGEGRVLLQRAHVKDGTDAWLISPETVAHVDAMFEAVKDRPADPRYALLGAVVPPTLPAATAAPPADESVPRQFRSPRDMLRGFLAAVEDGQTDDARMMDATKYLDLSAIPPEDRKVRGPRLATDLELVLRGLPFRLDDVPDSWNAPPQVLSGAEGLKVEVVRTPQGWRFSEDTVANVPAMYQKLPGEIRRSRDRRTQFGTPRETMYTFLFAANQNDWDLAAQCLDLRELSPVVRAGYGPVLAAKLKYVLDRLGRVYLPSIPNNPDGRRYVHYRGDLGRISIARADAEQGAAPDQPGWQFTAETVQRIEPMFAASMHRPVDEALADVPRVVQGPPFWEQPGMWVRLRVPAWLQTPLAGLALYQYLGVVLAVAAGLAVARLLTVVSDFGATWVLRRRGATSLSRAFVAEQLRPLTWALALWLAYFFLGALDLPLWLAGFLLPLQKFLLAGLLAWAGLRLLQLGTAAYANSEHFGEQRGLGVMLVPGVLRVLKVLTFLLFLSYVVYQVAGADWLVRLLTALGIFVFGVTLASQDTIKNFFGTATLVSERPFKIGDWIVVDDNEGVVEEVAFRATHLRTFEGELVTVPNALLVTTAVKNKGGRAFRVLSTRFLLDPSPDPGRVQQLADALRRRLLALPGLTTRKASVSAPAADRGPVWLKVVLVYLAPDDSADERAGEEVEAATREVARSLGVSIRGEEPAGKGGHRPGALGQELATR